MIDLRTLGALDLRVRDGPELLSVLSQPKRTALLCYLALAQPRGFHRRDTLLALFWPEADAEHARASLRQAVRFLRRSLGDDVVCSRGDDDLAIGEGVLECDGVRFEEALGAGEQERALSLYRGDLLPGFYVEEAPDFERWLEAERTRLRRSAVAAAWALAEACERAGDAGGAAEWARKALALAPDDAGLRRLMQTLERVGDRAGALATYESWARRLRAEYEIEPSAEARTVAEEIRGRGQTAAAARVGSATTPLPAGPGSPEAAGHSAGARPADPAPGAPVEARPAERPRRRGWAVAAAGLTLVLVLGAAGAVALRRARAAAPAASGGDVASVAVLPFADLSPGRDQAYFADGVTEELITLLGTVPGLRVPGRTSSFYFRGKQVPPTEIARQLGVRHLVEGSVRKVGRGARVTVELTDPWTGHQLWSSSLDAAGGDVVALEKAVAQQVISSLRLSATTFPARMPRLPEAYDLYLQASYTSEQEWAKGTAKPPMTRTIELLTRALDLDPGFAAAWAALAHAYYREGDFPRAKAAAGRALALDSTLVLARGALAHSLSQGEWRWAEAERVLDRGVELAPSQPYIYLARAVVRGTLGQYDGAVADHDRAEQLEPLGTEFLAGRVQALYGVGRPDQAVRAFERLPRVDSIAWREALVPAALAYIAIGQTAMAQSLALAKRDTSLAVLARGDRAEMLERMRVLEARGNGTCMWRPDILLEYYRVLGLTERTFECLEEHIRRKHRWTGGRLRHAGLDPAIAASPRYHRLMQEVGLPLLPPTSYVRAARPDTSAGSRSISPR